MLATIQPRSPSANNRKWLASQSNIIQYKGNCHGVDFTNRYRLIFGWMFFGLVLSVGSVWSAEFYVAVDGSDANPGTKAEPLATIANARDVVRAPKSAELVTVCVCGGTYGLAKPVVFTLSRYVNQF